MLIYNFHLYTSLFEINYKISLRYLTITEEISQIGDRFIDFYSPKWLMDLLPIPESVRLIVSAH